MVDFVAIKQSDITSSFEPDGPKKADPPPNEPDPKDWEKFDELPLHDPLNEKPVSTIVPAVESISIHNSIKVARDDSTKIRESAKILLDPSHLQRAASLISPPSIIACPINVNGKILATVYPENLTCDWVTPPNYDSHSMPSILAIDEPTLPPEDFISAMKAIIEDIRFKMYCTIYSRMIGIWMAVSILILIAVLLSQSRGGWPVMIFCLVWTVVLFVGIYVCAVLRKKIRVGVRHCVEGANKVLLRHHLLIGVEDKGQLSCHKVTLHFMRFNIVECMADVARQVRINRTGGCIFGSSPDQISTEEADKEAYELVLKYAQDFVKSTVKHRNVFPTKPTHGTSDYTPKHCKSQLCLCQFIDEKFFRAKPKKWYEKLLFLCNAPVIDTSPVFSYVV
ncbi:unnamed protein product [Caenorhabditis auriculariae]|uniref:Uncharacterized protein n=1 Tax=Caenorhabditis auriculariae TaxID=2777116 RepID=A0A8S1GSC2_9PELO|nr:unnamed protein product [Caenorhabditis auriculariae]